MRGRSTADNSRMNLICPAAEGNMKRRRKHHEIFS